MKILYRKWKVNKKIYSTAMSVLYNEDEIKIMVNNPKLKDNNIKIYALIRNEDNHIIGKVTDIEGNKATVIFNRKDFVRDIGTIFDFYSEYNKGKCRIEAGNLDSNEIVTYKISENKSLKFYKTKYDNLSLKVSHETIETEYEEDEKIELYGEHISAQVTTIYSLENGFEIKGYISNTSKEDIKEITTVIMKNREMEYTKELKLINKENTFVFNIDLEELELTNTGIWEFYIPYGDKYLKIKSTYDDIENKQKVINIPQIIYQSQNTSMVYKMYYTKKNEIALLIRNYITVNKVEKTSISSQGIIIEGEFYVEPPMQKLQKNIYGEIIIINYNIDKKKYKCSIETIETLNLYKTKFTLKIREELRDEEILKIKRALCYNIAFLQFEVEDYKVKTNIKIDAKYIISENDVLVGKELEKAKSKYLKLNKVLPIDDKLIVFQSFHGKSYSCNPKALCEALRKEYKDYKAVWVLENENTEVPRGVEIVKPNSKKYFYYMAKAKYFINNGNFPDFYEKRKGTIHLQTWHGTPLKTLGADISENSPSYKENNSIELKRRNKRWDYLIGPNEYTSTILKRAFSFEGEMLDLGYPRNDILHAENKEMIRESIKTRLGIQENKKVILYAPTWRDGNFHGGDKNKGYNIKFSIERFREKFGEEYVLLLRLHYREATSLFMKEQYDNVINVSFYDDIQELYLITDLLITDYSSVMFDYGNLKRNTIFYCYDYKEYSKSMRGWYVTLSKIAPGPIVFDEEQLFTAIENIEEIEEQYKDKIEIFNKEFCSWDDGHASSNVLKEIIK
ncbi:MAG: CDP-glycerol glycerophosphotransferase family protein [Clostridium sp.]